MAIKVWVDVQDWQPWENTLAYYKFFTDWNDYSWNNYHLTTSNVTFNWNNWALFNWTNSLAYRDQSVLWTWDKQFTATFTWKTNTLTNTRWEFFSFMRDVSWYRWPLLSLRNTKIHLDYNWIAFSQWDYNFTVELDKRYITSFIHRTAYDNDLYINWIFIWTVTSSSPMNLYWNKMESHNTFIEFFMP